MERYKLMGNQSDQNRKKHFSTVPPSTPARLSSHPNAIFQLPPKKIIRADADYTAEQPNEISFKSGDCFFVIAEKVTEYEVINPVEKSRGLVPKFYFEELKSGSSLGPVSKPETLKAPTSPLRKPVNHGPSERIRTTNNHSTNNREISRSPFRRSIIRPNSPIPPPRHDSYLSSIQSPETPHHSVYKIRDSVFRLEKKIGLDTGRFQIPSDSSCSQTSVNARRSSVSLFDLDQISKVYVPNCDMQLGEWVFIIRLELFSAQAWEIYRTYDDFWQMQIFLLKNFHEEAGYTGEGRIIPFLTPPSQLSRQDFIELCSYLQFYLERILSLPPEICEFPKVKEFFAPIGNDHDIDTSSFIDPTDLLITLVSEFKIDRDVQITLIVGSRRFKWTENSLVSYIKLRSAIRMRVPDFQEIVFKDEMGKIIVIEGNEDVGLLFQMPKITLYVSD